MHTRRNTWPQLPFVISITALALVWATASVGQPVPSKSHVVDRSSDLPDGIAFQQFLRMLTPTNEAPDRYAELNILASALGKHEEVKGNYELLRPRLNELDARRDAVAERDATLSYKAICTNDRASRSIEANYALLNDLDDIPITVAKAELEDYLSTLSKSERKSFRSYLTKIKQSTSFERIDAREAIRKEDVAMAVEKQCLSLQERLQQNGRRK